MNVFHEMALSIYSYKSYRRFLKNESSKVLGFGVLLITIYFMITMVISDFINPDSFLKWVGNLSENIPDFALENGTLWAEDVIEFDNHISYMYINTTPGYTAEYTTELAQAFRSYTSVVIMDSEKAIAKRREEWAMIYFSDLDREFHQEDLMRYAPLLYVGYIFFLLIAYICMAALFFFGVLFVALIGKIIAAIMNVRLTFGQVYLLGIYSRTLPLAIKALVSLLPFSIPHSSVWNFGLSLIILALAIHNLKKTGSDDPSLNRPPV